MMDTWFHGATQKLRYRAPRQAGSGLIRVRDASGTITTSAATLNVPYSILANDFGGSGGVKQLNLANNNGSGGYTIKYSINTANSGVNIDASPAKATFQRALNTWKQGVGVNFIEGGTTNIQSVNLDDGENVIMFDNDAANDQESGVPVPMPVGVLATCYTGFGKCSGSSSEEAYESGFDIVIRNMGFSSGTTSFTFGPCPPLNATSPQVDLESVLLHELGHAISLGHIIDGFQGRRNWHIQPWKGYAFRTGN